MKRRKAGKERKKELYELVKSEKKLQRREYMSFLERISEASSMTADISGDFCITLAGQNCMVIRNYRSISEYTVSKIRLKTSHNELIVEGAALQLEYSMEEELKIRGKITRIEFPSGTEGA